MHRVARMRTILLKYPSPARTARSRLLPSALLLDVSSCSPSAAAAFCRGSNMRSAGTGCLRRRAQSGNFSRTNVATETLARSIISSTSWFASLTWYMPTSSGSCVSESISKRTSGDARVSAPASWRRLRSFLAMAFRPRMSSVSGSDLASSSILACASAYVSAAVLLMTLFVNRVLTTSASGVISQMALNARRSTPPRSEQMSSVRGLGSMSILRSTR
mmetsp:Transcript_1150/g.3774  ORF Transcript_1150/g.3774 Transcript_1150/m.3774 type:complete len:218 (-) Transcript_1150:749-1402(-)